MGWPVKMLVKIQAFTAGLVIYLSLGLFTLVRQIPGFKRLLVQFYPDSKFLSMMEINVFQVKEFKRLMEQYSNEVDFLVIYIREAHPINGWSFANNKYQIYDHKSLKERISAARIFADDAQVKCPVVVDNMNDEAAVQYAALPERLYILQDNLVKYDGARGPFGYNLSEMEESLKNCLQKV